jgi:hypothetical protein
LHIAPFDRAEAHKASAAASLSTSTVQANLPLSPLKVPCIAVQSALAEARLSHDFVITNGLCVRLPVAIPELASRAAVTPELTGAAEAVFAAIIKPATIMTRPIVFMVAPSPGVLRR